MFEFSFGHAIVYIIISIVITELVAIPWSKLYPTVIRNELSFPIISLYAVSGFITYTTIHLLN